MASDKITNTQILLPVFLLSFVVTLFLGFQTTLLVADHGALKQARAQQDKPLEQLAKIKAQVNALAIGTLHLAKDGNKDAQVIIGDLKKAGVDVSDQAQGTPGTAPAAPAAN